MQQYAVYFSKYILLKVAILPNMYNMLQLELLLPWLLDNHNFMTIS